MALECLGRLLGFWRLADEKSLNHPVNLVKPMFADKLDLQV